MRWQRHGWQRIALQYATDLTVTRMNTQIILARRPEGFPKESDFKRVTSPVPTPAKDEILVRTLYLSVDPYMRGRMFQFADRYQEGLKQLTDWLKAGKIRYREEIVEGIENAPRAFIGMLQGQNIGKQLVKVAEVS